MTSSKYKVDMDMVDTDNDYFFWGPYFLFQSLYSPSQLFPIQLVPTQDPQIWMNFLSFSKNYLQSIFCVFWGYFSEKEMPDNFPNKAGVGGSTKFTQICGRMLPLLSVYTCPAIFSPLKCIHLASFVLFHSLTPHQHHNICKSCK